ncbi:MAG: DedA family protein [Candidatus ainarchaeum sp.]|nr:DedA family protein [Candidatus ainarchaeum sp.]
MLESIALWLVSSVGLLGYWGIILLMAIESSFFPLPSELIMIPAGYLASQGQMNLLLAWVCGVIGSLLGALFNYYLALLLGRPFIDKYGKYFLLTKSRMAKVDAFFEKHGEITTFTGRLIFGIRHLISLPAGLARMNLFKFCLYTVLGSGIWVAILLALGYFIGKNYDVAVEYSWLVAGLATTIILAYVIYYIYKNKKVFKNEKD